MDDMKRESTGDYIDRMITLSHKQREADLFDDLDDNDFLLCEEEAYKTPESEFNKLFPVSLPLAITNLIISHYEDENTKALLFNEGKLVIKNERFLLKVGLLYAKEEFLQRYVDDMKGVRKTYCMYLSKRKYTKEALDNIKTYMTESGVHHQIRYYPKYDEKNKNKEEDEKKCVYVDEKGDRYELEDTFEEHDEREMENVLFDDEDEIECEYHSFKIDLAQQGWRWRHDNKPIVFKYELGEWL